MFVTRPVLLAAFLTTITAVLGTATAKVARAESENKAANVERPLYAGRDFDTWVHLSEVDLDDTTRWQAVLAIGALGKHGREKDALNVLTPLVHSPDRSLRASSHQSLAHLGDAGVVVLVQALNDKKYSDKESIIRALGKAGPQASASTKELLRITDGDDVELRRRAFEALLAIGTPAKEIAAAIEREVDINDDPHAKNMIIFGLHDSPMEYESKERLLIMWLNGADRDTARSAATVLSIVGKNNDSVREALRLALRDYAIDPINRGACPNVSGNDVNVELLLPLLIEVAEKQDLSKPDIRNGAFLRNFVDQVGQLGEGGRDAMPTLLKILAARNTQNLSQIDFDLIQSLWEMGAAAEDALPVLKKARQELLQRKVDELRPNEKLNRDFEVEHLNKAIERIESPIKRAK